MLRFSIIFPFLALLLLPAMAIDDGNHMVYWADDRPLSWRDYQGVPDYSSSEASALTSSGILHYKGCDNGLITFNIKAYFEKLNSWVKPKARTSYNLQHEQLHFDITQLYAFKLEKALTEKAYTCDQSDEFDAFVKSFLVQWQRAELNYDLDTHYSKKVDRQELWNQKVAEQLKVFSDKL